jgi:general secretion pathway protein F
MVHAGETSGTLEIVLDRLADMTEKQQALNMRIRSALAYPALMTVIGILVLALLLTYIVPSIAGVFSEMNQVLPTPTRLLIAVSSLFKSYGWVLLLAAAVAVPGLRSLTRTSRGRHLWDKLLLSLPLAGPLVRKLAVARFARTLGSLLENGVSLLPALEIVKNIVANTLSSKAIDSAIRDVGKGQGLSQALTVSTLPGTCLQMIQSVSKAGSWNAC